MDNTRRSLIKAAAGLAALSSFNVKAQAGGSYVLGTLFPMSGSVAELGTVFTNGVTLALEHIAADKMLSRPMVLKAQDSLATPQGGAVGMSRLVNVDNAPFVLVGVTGVSKAAAPIGARKKVVMVNGGGVSPELAEMSPYFWNLIPLADQEIPPALQWLKKQGKTRVALVYVDDPLGAAVLRQLKSGLPKVGGELVGSYSVPPGMEQFSAIAAQIRQTNADAIYFASYGSQQLQIIKQLRDAGLNQQLLTYSIGSLPSVINLPESEGLIFTTQLNDLTRSDPITSRFISAWREKYKRDPSSYAQNYYNGAMLYAQLLAELEKTGQDVNGDTMRAAMLRIRTFKLAGGDIAFNDNGTSTMPIQINQVVAREMKVVG
ncbi:ABC transporter substrate-binding protein [Parapusillimonas granuli]|uniref:ABC transporter substrate-binding protein n=1 Tax=Parapusillimonas granuli TaxID=380911 RepID=A0A853FQ25_9BURK|nr:ABC transporter substrate-binding protein [Parapusillimonas granuli]MBB5216176.1 ABC-type branched-subunit amino acid transport system substrate-binding protein [Parapusillimonas granuli]MEB2400451.1 ABC transporter substrate-binding protein [Alcaligenaceae bacterium]NYT47855.1 ABC transporter substrate-binding protein [Parapusillimonas granuli]